MNKIISMVITSLFLVGFLVPVFGENDNDDNPCNKPLKIIVHVEDFPSGVEVEAGTEEQSKTKFSDGDTVTFTFKDVDVGEEIWATVEGATDYGTNQEQCEPEHLYPQNNNNNNNDLFEVEVEQQAQCNIYGDYNECNINQYTEVGPTYNEYEMESDESTYNEQEYYNSYESEQDFNIVVENGAECNIEGDDNECNINQGSSVLSNVKDFVGDLFN